MLLRAAGAIATPVRTDSTPPQQFQNPMCRRFCYFGKQEVQAVKRGAAHDTDYLVHHNLFPVM
jgi:hypothetical protein